MTNMIRDLLESERILTESQHKMVFLDWKQIRAYWLTKDTTNFFIRLGLVSNLVVNLILDQNLLTNNI